MTPIEKQIFDTRIMQLFNSKLDLEKTNAYTLMRFKELEYLQAKTNFESTPEFKEIDLLEKELLAELQKNDYNESFECPIGKVEIRKAHERIGWNTEELKKESEKDEEFKKRFEKKTKVKKSVSIVYGNKGE